MSLFGEIKCGRCDRRYSAARAKCPYCGARKSRSGRRIDTTDANSKWKLIAGIVLLLIIVVAVVVVILISVKDGDNPPADISPSTSVSESGGVVSVETDPLPSESVEPTDTGSPSPTTPQVVDIILNREDFTLSSIGESWTLEATIVPDNTGMEVTWRSEDESVAIVDLNGKVTAMGRGTTNIYATAGGVEKSCIVRVNADSTLD